MRAAYDDYIAAGSAWPGMIEDPVSFKGVFEIAPTDFLGNNSKGVPWTIIAGMCDGDVSDLEGVDVYDRDVLPPFESHSCRSRHSSCGVQTTISSTRSGRSATARTLICQIIRRFVPEPATSPSIPCRRAQRNRG